jgi:uncharacterized protein (DUF433 family)
VAFSSVKDAQGMTIQEAVFKDAQVMSGELCFTGTRVPVRNLFGYLKHGDPLEEFLADFPGVSSDQAETVLSASLDELGKKVSLQTQA